MSVLVQPRTEAPRHLFPGWWMVGVGSGNWWMQLSARLGVPCQRSERPKFLLTSASWSPRFLGLNKTSRHRYVNIQHCEAELEPWGVAKVRAMWVPVGRIDPVRGTGHLASSVLNHLMTWDFVLIWETRVCQNMSKDVTCRSGLRCNGDLWSSAKLRGFSSAFWDGRTYATLSGMSHCHTIHLRSKSLALSIRADLRREGIGAAAHFESSEARLMWIVCFDG